MSAKLISPGHTGHVSHGCDMEIIVHSANLIKLSGRSNDVILTSIKKISIDETIIAFPESNIPKLKKWFMNIDLPIYVSTPRVPLRLRLRFLLGRIREFTSGVLYQEPTASPSLESEFRKIIACESGTISKICFAYASSADDFEDLRQDALINIWRGMSHFRGESSRSTWVYRITVNSCLTSLRKQSRHRHESLDNLYGLIECDDDNREQIEQLHRVIDSLGQQERAIIMMWLDEMSYDEIAEAMGLNRNTVATRLRRIKDKIAELYRKEDIS